MRALSTTLALLSIVGCHEPSLVNNSLRQGLRRREEKAGVFTLRSSRVALTWFRGSAIDYGCGAVTGEIWLSLSCACSSSGSNTDELRSASYLRTRLPLDLTEVVVALP